MIGVFDSAHIAGMILNCFLPLGLGLTNYLVPGSNTDLILYTLRTEDINIVVSSPPVLQRLVIHPNWSTTHLPSLQLAVVGASKSSPELLQAVTKNMPTGRFCQQGWGMTELSCFATMPSLEVLGPWESVGRPLHGNRIKIYNEQGVEMPMGQEGEVYIAGKEDIR